MPYKTNADLPEQVRTALPDAAQTRFRTVVNGALGRGLDDSKAFASAWAVVGNGWEKPKGGKGKWVRKQVEPQSLYISRKLENAADLIRWAKDNGFATTLPPEQMHATICYSKSPMDWPEGVDDQITVRHRPGRALSQFGDATVLQFDSPTFAARHQELRDAGASYAFDEYKPHVTLTWNGPGKDLSGIQPYTGPLVFGPEILNPINPDWMDNVIEKANPNHDQLGRFATGEGGGELPIPKAGGSVVYDVAVSHGGGMLTVRRNPDGSFYGQTDKFDFEAKNETDLRARLARMKASLIGYEKVGARHSRADQSMLQDIHDYAVKLGATCDGAEVEKHDNDDDVVTNVEKAYTADVLKVDESLGLVFGWAIVSKVDGNEYFDTQQDHIPEEAMLVASAEFMLDNRMAKEMHVGGGKGTIVFAWPMTEDIAKAMGITSRYTGLMIAMKPDNPAVLAKFRPGPNGEAPQYTGFSIGGRRLVDEEAA